VKFIAYFLLYSSDNRLRLQTVRGVCFLQTLLRKNEDVENGVRWSRLWRGLGGIIDMTDLIDNYPHSIWQPFGGGRKCELVERIVLRVYYYGSVLYCV
jgi:hypothetical protein